MASLNLCRQFETNLMSNRKVIKLLLQLKSAKAHSRNYIKVRPPLVRHLLRNRLFFLSFSYYNFENNVTNSERDMFKKESLTHKQNFKRLVFSDFCSACIFRGTNFYS